MGRPRGSARPRGVSVADVFFPSCQIWKLAILSRGPDVYLDSGQVHPPGTFNICDARGCGALAPTIKKLPKRFINAHRGWEPWRGEHGGGRCGVREGREPGTVRVACSAEQRGENWAVFGCWDSGLGLGMWAWHSAGSRWERSWQGAWRSRRS